MAETKQAAEVMLRLVVDSNAKAATDDLAKHLGKADSDAKKKAKTLDTSLKGNLGSLKTLAGAGMGIAAAAAAAGVGALVGFGYKAAEAFQESQKQVKALASTLTLIDQKGNSFAKLREYASGLKDELEEVAMQTGVTDDTAVAMFNDIAERGGKSVEQAKDLTQQMILAGRAFPGGPEALSEGFSMMEMGIIRARNPLVQMIAATHQLKGNAKQVAAELQKMPIDKQMEVAEKAIAKMSGKMKDVPMTMGEMKTSLHVAVQNVFEDAGEPIVGAMKPIVKKVRDLFFENKDAIGQMANGLGEGIAKALDMILPVVDEVIAAVRENWDEIKGAFDAIYGPGKELFEYIYEHKGEFAKTIGQVVSELIKAAVWIAKAMAAVRDAVAGVAKFVGKGAANLVTGGEFGKAMAEEDLVKRGTELESAVKGRGTGFREVSKEQQAELRKNYVEAAEAAGRSAIEAQNLFDQAFNRASQDHRNTMDQVGQFEAGARHADTESFVRAFKIAQAAHDEGAMAFVAHFLDSSKQLQKALGEDGPKLLGAGFDALMATLKAEGDKGVIEGIKTAAKPNLGIGTKTTINQNFSGPINVKQDFRDQDPDRVAVVFREDLAKVGSSRLQSRFSMPFGF